MGAFLMSLSMLRRVLIFSKERIMQLILSQICLNSFQLYISQLGNVALSTNCIIGLI